MLKLTVIEFFLRAIPEGFLFMFAGYAFSRVVLDKGRFIKSSVVLATTGYLIRLLPISFGVHSILGVIAFIVLNIMINKIELTKSVTTGIIIFVIQFISEFINFLIIENIFRVDVNEIFSNPITKSISGIPSLLITGCLVGIYYFRLLRKNKLKCNTNLNGF